MMLGQLVWVEDLDGLHVITRLEDDYDEIRVSALGGGVTSHYVFFDNITPLTVDQTLAAVQGAETQLTMQTLGLV